MRAVWIVLVIRGALACVLASIPLVAAAQPTDPDIDVAGLGGEPEGPEPISLYGFADFSWRALMVPRGSFEAHFFPKENSFLVGNVNLYATKKLSKKWRSLLEIRFMHAPATTTADGTFLPSTGPDPADLERPIEWGGISIQRVYLEYELAEWLTIQAGSFLTPYGIWNVDHGSPSIIPVTRPYIIGEGLFPDQQTGLHLYGMHPIGDYQLNYDVTLTNGRGPYQAVRDLDDNKAVGGRIELETPWLDGIHFGVSIYHGEYTNRPADVLVADASGTLVNTTPSGTRYTETAVGLDVLLHHGPLHVQAEVLWNDRDYLAGAREATRGGFVPNGRYVGAYALVGYRFDGLWQIMPFAELEIDRMRSGPDLGTNPLVFQGTIGLNFRPDPSVTLKIELVNVDVDAPLLDLDYRSLMTQAAWAF